MPWTQALRLQFVLQELVINHQAQLLHSPSVRALAPAFPVSRWPCYFSCRTPGEVTAVKRCSNPNGHWRYFPDGSDATTGPNQSCSRLQHNKTHEQTQLQEQLVLNQQAAPCPRTHCCFTNKEVFCLCRAKQSLQHWGCTQSLVSPTQPQWEELSVSFVSRYSIML